MPVARGITALAAFTAIATLLGTVACSSDSDVDPGTPVANSEIDQTVVTFDGSSIAVHEIGALT
jgi:hypothetical protein